MIKTTNYTDRTKEKETIYIHFTFKDLTVENFLFAVQTKLKLNSIYSLLIKIASYNNSIFKMCGTQIGLVFKNEFDINHLKMLYEVIITRIEETGDLYDFMGEIEIVEIKFSKLSLQKTKKEQKRSKKGESYCWKILKILLLINKILK